MTKAKGKKTASLRLTKRERSEILKAREKEAEKAVWTKSGKLKSGHIKCGHCFGNGSIDYSEDEYSSNMCTCGYCVGLGQLSPTRVARLVMDFKRGLDAQ